MKLKEIIIEELVFGFKQNKPKWWDYEAYLKFIEPIIRSAVNSATGNITTKDDWQVIASGEVEFVAGDIHINGESEWEWTGIISNILNEKFEGKNIEIAIRVKK